MVAGNIVLGADRGTGGFAGRVWRGDDSFMEVSAMRFSAMFLGDMVEIKDCSMLLQ